MNRKLKILLGFTFIILVSTEIFLRSYYGFCDTVLMIEDKEYEYIPAPSQQRFRFRHHIYYNALSMRSSEIDCTAVTLLGFGDSIINGGVLTDQEDLATTKLSKQLTERIHKKVQFLNISAGSWGPDNCYAYLKKHGHFNAAHIYLFVSSHDAYDNMDFSKIVGVNESFPDKQFAFAIVELVERYLLPRLGFSTQTDPVNGNNLGINKKKSNSRFNTGFPDFERYCRENKIPFTMYLHAELSEVETGKYNEQGQEIIRFAQAHHIPLIKDLEAGLLPSDFRDDIHLNENGQNKLAKAVLGAGISLK